MDLDKLLNRRLFKIPEYQRAYSWKQKQVRDLMGDIQSSFEKMPPAEHIQTNRDIVSQHFMATIVGLKQGTKQLQSDRYDVIDVVDGQQRITTLILLYRAIAKALDDSKVEKVEKRLLDEMLLKRGNPRLPILQANHDNSQHFENYIRKGTRPQREWVVTPADKNVFNAIVECERFVNVWKEKHSLIDLIDHLKNDMKFVYYEIDTPSMVYSVFESLNSRGLPVSWFDRLKSMLMRMLYEQHCDEYALEGIHKRWSEIYRIVGTGQELSSESLRFAATLRDKTASKVSSEENAANILSGKSTDCDAIVDTASWIQTVARAVKRIHDDNKKAVTKVAHARLVATAIELRDDISDDGRSKLFACWERVTFRIYGLFGKDSRSEVGNYVRLAYRIHAEQLPTDSILKALIQIGKNYPIEQAVDEFKKNVEYDEDDVRYILFKYDTHLGKKMGLNSISRHWETIWAEPPNATIEHISPRKDKQDYMQRFGNLLILPSGINSKLNHTPVNEKGEMYMNTGLLIAKEVVERLDDWNESAVDERENRIFEWIQKEWAD